MVLTFVSRYANTRRMTRQTQLIRHIRSRLALRGFTQRDLGEALGLGHASISARMNGHRDFSFTELEKAADFLGISLRDLVTFERDEAVAL